jgi:hypothetical protein
MKRVTIHNILVKHGSLFSPGSGFDDEGNPVKFIGKTEVMTNINKDLLDYEEHPEHGRPRIYLEAWQEV